MIFMKTFLLLVIVMVTHLFAYPNYSQALKEKRIYPMGKKIIEHNCPSIKADAFASYDLLLKELQTQSRCKKLPKRYIEAAALYLWDHRAQTTKMHEHYPSLSVTKKQKCPVCGMFLYKYPRWVSVIVYDNGKKLYFDGLKDLLKYYFKDPKHVAGLYTRDYYTQETIAAKDAYFVIGSDVYGPMGREFIAFKNKESARHFLMDHRGKKILPFDAIDEALVYKLDE